MGLSRSAVDGAPGTLDTIGAFISTNPALQYGSYPAGTTNAYLNNASAAQLRVPAGSDILYAELLWGGTYINGNVNLSAVINNPVSFVTPAGTFSVASDVATRNTFEFSANAFGYIRSANVTALVAQGGAGTYATGQVPAIIAGTDPPVNVAGWTLAVIYRNPSLPFRNLSLRAGAVLVQADSSAVTTTLTGFATPVTGPLGGRALFSAMEGDAARTGDQALFGPANSSLAALSGPNNFANNFFASQINGDTGQLDTSGTFGNRNATNGAPGANVAGGRQGWDITNVDISARLVNNQSSAALRLTTSGDAYVVTANGIQIDINAPRIEVTKSAGAASAIAGDTVAYTVTVRNTGTANAASVVLTDALPPGATLVPGSVSVGGVARPSANLAAGVPLGSLALGASVTVTYRVTIGSGAAGTTLSNQANAAFTFQSVAGGETIAGVIPSNPVDTPIYAPILTVGKSANTTNAVVGGTVTYTFTLRNTGNIATASTALTDPVPAGSVFRPGTLLVNGVAATGNPNSGIAVGTIPVGGTATVSFQTEVLSLPSPPVLTDQATAAFTYRPPDGRTIGGAAFSNTLSIPVSLPNVTVAKSANRTGTTIGDTITFASVVANANQATLADVVFFDAMPAYLRFVPGSVAVNGVAREAAAPANGISLGTLPPGTDVTVSFQATVASVPPQATVVNDASVAYRAGNTQGAALSNVVSIPFSWASIEIVKEAQRPSLAVGETVTYSISLRNAGNAAANATVTDPLPPELAFLPGSVAIDGVPQPSSSPATGIPVMGIVPGGTAVVTFQAVLQALPSPPRVVNRSQVEYRYALADGRTFSEAAVSNRSDIPASAPSLTIEKRANRATAALTDEIVYTVVVTNQGSAPAANAVLSDSLSEGGAYVAGSVTIDGAARRTANPGSGVPIGAILPGASVAVSYRARVERLPTSGELRNTASVSFRSGALPLASSSSPVVVSIGEPLIHAFKSPSRASAAVGESLAYTVRIVNRGNASADVSLTDLLPEDATFVENSVIVGDEPRPGTNPTSGIPVGAIAPGGETTVSFLVNVASVPANSRLTNRATVGFSFALPDGSVRTGTAATDEAFVLVTSPLVSVTLDADRDQAVAEDRVVYTAVVTNEGDAAATNVVFAVPALPGALFLPGSVTVDGSSRPNADPTAGIPIGTLAPGASVTITYEVRLTMPTPEELVNRSTVSFTSGTISASAASNTEITPVTQPDISVEKTASSSAATVGDTVAFTVVVRNTGNLPAEATITDILPTGTAFVENSVVVNGMPYPGADPAAGIDIGAVAPGQSTVATFSVIVEDLPPSLQLTNVATTDFTFATADGRTFSRSVASNVITLSVSAPNVEVVKSTTVADAAVGEIVPYTITVTNRGATTIANVVLSDAIPNGTTFVEDSVVVNGIAAPDVAPQTGVPLPNLAAGESATVAFDVLVNALPSPPAINNQSFVAFTSGTFSAGAFSNTVATPVAQAIVTLTKRASANAVTVGDTLSYTIDVANDGNAAALVTIDDPLPAGTVFVPNSVVVDGTPLAGANPESGFSIGEVAAGDTSTVSFSVIVDTLPSPPVASNAAEADFTFVTPSGRTIEGSARSNVVTIPVSSPNVTVVKGAGVTEAVVGDTIPYTVRITNLGGTEITNLIFADGTPPGTAFVPGSVVVDGEARADADPSRGVPIRALPVGASVELAFEATVTELTESAVVANRASVVFRSGAFFGASFSNETTTPVYQAILAAEKAASDTNTTVGNTEVFTVTIRNTGNVAANATLTDPMPEGVAFVPNSVLANGLPLPGASPESGIPLGQLAPGASTTVSFSIVVDAVPPAQTIVNRATVDFSFATPGGRTVTGSTLSNTVTLQVSLPNVTVAKSTSVLDVPVGDTIPYTVVVTNDGADEITDVVLTDAVPPHAEWVAGSVVVDGEPRPGADPRAGIRLGTIAPGATRIVGFSLRVLTLPSPAEVANQATVAFTSGTFSGVSYSNVATTPAYQAVVAVVKSANRSVVTLGNSVVYSFEVRNTGNAPARIVLRDSVPDGATFVPNSVIVDGLPRPGADPEAGIDLGAVPAGETVLVRVTLQASVESLPSPQQITNQATVDFSFETPSGRSSQGSALSNVVTVQVSSPDVTVAKTSDASSAVVGDTITYTVTVTNNSVDPITNVVVSDPIPQGTRLVPGSVIVDGQRRPTDNPATGILVPVIEPGGSATVTFQVIVE